MASLGDSFTRDGSPPCAVNASLLGCFLYPINQYTTHEEDPCVCHQKKASAIGEEERNSKLCLRVRRIPLIPAIIFFLGGGEGMKPEKRRREGDTEMELTFPPVHQMWGWLLLTFICLQWSFVKIQVL
uniref:Uncharacterized protein n=1 Tax=Micrurus lemniscatus lemniscatus TaxID=129467 RepID=A0A2D4IC15_MICLE